jgi:hypothetical protein
MIENEIKKIASGSRLGQSYSNLVNGYFDVIRAKLPELLEAASAELADSTESDKASTTNSIIIQALARAMIDYVESVSPLFHVDAVEFVDTLTRNAIEVELSSWRRRLERGN